MPKSESQESHRRKHLLKTLQYIANDPEFAALPADQNKFLFSAYSKLKSSTGNDWNIEIPQVEIPIYNKDLVGHDPTLLIGGNINGVGDKIKLSSFSVCIVFKTGSSDQGEPLETQTNTISLNVPSCCLNQHRNKKRIVRRFHFDFQPDSQGKPISHVQYGGKFPESAHYKDYHYCLEHFLENPRFHYFPIDLALLFDLIINEFITPLRKWTQEDNWKGLVLKSQDLWWKDYCTKLAECINNPQGKSFHARIYSG